MFFLKIIKLLTGGIELENIKLDDFTKYKFLSGIRFSPDGKYACFAVREADVEENGYRSNLWVYEVERNRYFRLTSFNKEGNFIWLADSENIVFSGIRNDKDKEKKKNGEEFTQFYKINIHGGEAVEFMRILKNVSSVRQLDESRFVFTSTCNKYKKELNELSEGEREEELKRRKEEKDYEVLDEIPFWSNGEGFTNKNRKRVYIYDVNSNRYEALTDETMDVQDYNLSEDKSKIVYLGTSFENKMELQNEVYVLDVENKSSKLISRGLSHSYANFISEDRIIVSANDMVSYGVNQNDKFYIADLEGKELKCITPDFERSTWNSVGSDCRYGGALEKKVDSGYLYFITTEIDSSYINRIDENGNMERVTFSKGSVDGFDVINGRIIFIGLRNMKLQELYSLEEEKEHQITEFNEWVVREKKITLPERIVVETAPGVLIDGWILKPVDFDENKKYPAILDIHGGPKTVYGEVLYHEMQYWANEGYAVFFCNPRGSDGRDNAFADIRGKYGTIDYDDIMKFTDYVLEKYKFIDGERVGVTGGSYGGFMTNWIIGHTDRFKAAASQRSISNWISKFNTTDIGYFFVDDQIGATPWNDFEKLWNSSPLKYADKVSTPTLFLHSEEDYRCWLAEGIQMYTALKYHGVDSRLIMFREENHELSRSGKPKHRIRRLKEITEWFNKYLKQM